jgi:hypothetical protein
MDHLYDTLPAFVDQEQNPPIDWGVTVEVTVNGEVGVHICALGSNKSAANLLRRAIRALEDES